MNVLVEPGSAHGFAIFVSTFPPLGGGPPSHHHDSYDEAFNVLSGEMEFRVDGQTARVPAGSMAWVPRGATHSFVGTPLDLSALNISMPCASGMRVSVSPNRKIVGVFTFATSFSGDWVQ